MFLNRLTHQHPQIFQQAQKWVKDIQRSLPGGALEAKGAGFANLFPRRARVQRLATGFRFTEGPVWSVQTRSLIFSDIPANKIFTITLNGRVEIFRNPSGNSNGLTLDLQGRLIACEHGNRRVSRTEHDGSMTILADSFNGKPLNSPNDVVVKNDGAVYFTDPPYGIKPEQQVQSIQGVYRLSPDGKELQVVAHDFKGPNGLAFSPDETQLFIDDSSTRRHIRVFDVRADGTLANGRLFYDMNVKETGSPDGMKVDSNGYLFCTGPGGIWVFDPTGRHVGRILIPEQPANCAWGDDDFCSLYITARTSVYRIRVNTPGITMSRP